MQNKFAEPTPRNFDPMSAIGLSDEARKAVTEAFDAMSAWRIETAKSSIAEGELIIGFGDLICSSQASII
jgi:hypothetical protein